MNESIFLKYCSFLLQYALQANSCLPKKKLLWQKMAVVILKAYRMPSTACLHDADAQRIILIKQGTYNEKIFIDKNFITFKGEKIQPKPLLLFRWQGMNGVAKTRMIMEQPLSI